VEQQEGELREAQDKFTVYREEMADTEMRIESLALDLEIAEEKVVLLTFHFPSHLLRLYSSSS
jgi:hypothetical protein